MNAVLGIDLGTSGVKAVMVNIRGGAIIASATAPLRLATPRPGWAEQDPEDWWLAAKKSVQSALRLSKLKAAQIVGIGLTGQMHSSVFLDSRGEVVRPALLWCDGRTSRECRDIEARVGQAGLRRMVGNPALEGFTLPKLLWLRRNEPAAWKRVSKVLLAKDYIRFRLSGELASEPSDASGTLYFDIFKRQWSLPVFKALGLKPSLLPELGGSEEVVGRLNAEGARALGLMEGTPIAGGGADNACGAVGVGAVEPGEAVASWGTSGTVLSVTRMPKVDHGLRAHAFCHALKNSWYDMGVMLSAGAAFAWYAKNLSGEASNLELNKEAAEIAPGAEGLTFLPYLQGERTPHRDPGARGALVGLSLAHTRAHVSRAVLEAVCFGLRDSLEILRRDLRLPVARVLLTGGGAASTLVRRMQADVYGLSVGRVNREEGPAYGAAILGAVASGVFKEVPLACKAWLKRLPLEKSSQETHKLYAKPYARYRALYGALKGL